MQVKDMNLNEKIEFLRQNPAFFTRFGLDLEKGNWENHTLNAKRHRVLYEKGILVHTSVIPSGWVGPNQYDYSEQ